MTSLLRVIDHNMLTSMSHKWFTYLVNLCNEIHNNVAHNDILGKWLLISSLPGKALRTLVDIARHAELFNMQSQSRAW